jgi:hypothetical protein
VSTDDRRAEGGDNHQSDKPSAPRRPESTQTLEWYSRIAMVLFTHVPSVRDHGIGSGPASPCRSPQLVERDSCPHDALPRAKVTARCTTARIPAHHDAPGSAGATIASELTCRLSDAAGRRHDSRGSCRCICRSVLEATTLIRRRDIAGQYSDFGVWKSRRNSEQAGFCSRGLHAGRGR